MASTRETVTEHSQGGVAGDRVHLTTEQAAAASRMATPTASGLLSAADATIVDYVDPPITGGDPGETNQRATNTSYLYFKPEGEDWRMVAGVDDWWAEIVDGIVYVHEGETYMSSSSSSSSEIELSSSSGT
jgi:hypothetical protein